MQEVIKKLYLHLNMVGTVPLCNTSKKILPGSNSDNTCVGNTYYSFVFEQQVQKKEKKEYKEWKLFQ